MHGPLLAWYDRTKRDLPWRRTSDPYAVWVSEVMLQQTTVAAAVPRWERFLARFPSVGALAAAGENEVLAQWAGLGYYSRARNLHRAARAMAVGGVLPRTFEGWRALPGVGDYTAAAVASIAFGERRAAVDANAARVLARVLGVGPEPSRLRAMAGALVPARRPGDFNQALMDLGATVCTPREPACGACPLAALCAARLSGRQEELTARKARKPVRRLRLAAGLALRGDRLVLCPDRLLVRGHLSLPAVQVPEGGDPERVLREAWPGMAGTRARRLEPLPALRHSVLDRRYLVALFRVREGARCGPAPSPAGTVLADPASLECLPHGGLLRKAIAVLFARAG